ncbi:hypothetical protein H4V97_002033 [Flavobacterium sp. CG_23.5]|nr:hypothetical protein [Flavobacterium sp. CG_23.5]
MEGQIVLPFIILNQTTFPQIYFFKQLSANHNRVLIYLIFVAKKHNLGAHLILKNHK